ncbi:autotransporter family protein [Phenylobacterium conjunctum]|uniref:Autotransporter domain-containing protein n=1 Tax=Phenylobacterium conjunctum TaxID=1298959 RepID=A0ABW3SY39_9CAUL
MSRKKAPHLQSLLRSSAAPALVGLTALAAGLPARADISISSSTTTPVATSTSGDISITSDGAVKPASGTAVTLDSDNTVTNAGSIYFQGVDTTTGVLIQGGHTGALTNTGTIEVDEAYTDTDSDSDGDYDGVFATGTGRYGVRLTGASAFVGDIDLQLGGAIAVRGNDSAGVLLETALQGSLFNAGTISVVGDRVFGLRAMSTVSGDVEIRGGVNATGLGAVALQFDNDLGGQLLIQSSVYSTGYRYTTRSSDTDFMAALDADDLLQGGSALVIKGDVAGGLLFDITPVDNDDSNDDEDGDGVDDANESAASVMTYGQAPAVVIGQAGRSVTLGNVGTSDDAYGLVNRGSIGADGVYDGITATALQVGVSGGTVSLTGGLRNQGSIATSAYEADAVNLHILSGAAVAKIWNEGTLSALMTGEGAHDAVALKIESGASVPSLVNALSISAVVSGEAGDAIAIADLSGTLTSLTNTHTISATISPTDDSDDTDDTDTDETNETITGKAIAIDVSANTTGVTITQTGVDDGDDGDDDVADTDTDGDGVDDADEPAIVGEIRFGSGADSLSVLNGAVAGDISFGAGANSLTIDGGATVTGALTATGGTLALRVGDGALSISNVGVLNLTSLNLGASSTLMLTVDPDAGTYTKLDVAGAASLASGAKIGLTLNSLLMNKASYTVVQADSLTSGVLDASLLGNVPYLYNASYAVDTTAGTLAIELSRKSASDLGLPSASAQAYEPLVQAINTDTDIRDAFLALQTRTGFVKAYNQMLPEHSGGVFQAVAAANDGFARAIDDRQGPDAGGVWLQETGYILTKDGSADDPGYKAGGFGVIGGAEVGAGRFGIVGASLGGSSSHVDPDGASSGSNLAVDTVEAGGYWRYVNGNLTLNARVAAAWLQATNHRAIYLLNDDQDTLLAKAVADGKWNGWAVTGRVAAAYEGRIGGFYARPSASVDYLRLEEDAYSEKNGGDAVDLHVSARQSSRSTGFAGLVAGKRYGDQDAWWGTEMTLGYREVGAGQVGSTTAKFLSGTTSFNVLADEIKGGGVVARIALKGENAGGAFVLEGGAETRDATAIYDLRLAAHFRF